MKKRGIKKYLSVVMIYAFIISLLPINALRTLVSAETLSNPMDKINLNYGISSVDMFKDFGLVTTDYGLIKVTPGESKVLAATSQYGHLFYAGTNGNYAYLMNQGNLVKVDLTTGAKVRNSITVDSPFFVMQPTLDSNKNIWFCGFDVTTSGGESTNSYYLMRINPENTADTSKYPISGSFYYADQMQIDSSNNIWFIEIGDGSYKLNRVSFNQDKAVEKAFDLTSVDPMGIFNVTLGQNGTLWMSDSFHNSIKQVQVTDSGLQVQKEYKSFSSTEFPMQVIKAKDGSIWTECFTDTGAMDTWSTVLKKLENGEFVNKYSIQQGDFYQVSIYDDYSILSYANGYNYAYAINGASSTLVSLANTKVSSAEATLNQADVDAARALVSRLANQSDRTPLISRLDAVQAKIDYAKVLSAATTAVTAAEASLRQGDVDAARALVSGLTNQTDKSALTNRLDAVQAKIDYAKVLSTATTAVTTAEASLRQGDVDAARALVSGLTNQTDKSALTSRLDAVQAKIDYNTVVAIATSTVQAAENSNNNQAAVDYARVLVNSLQAGNDKTALTQRLDQVQAAIDAAKAAAKISNDNSVVNNLVNKAAGTTTTVSCSDNPTAKSEIFTAIKGTDKSVVFEENGVQWKFNGKDINSEIKNIDLSVNVAPASESTSTNKQDILSAVSSSPVEIISFAENGKLPGAAEVTVNLGSSWANKTGIYVYYYNPTTKASEAIAGPVNVDASGNITFTITHNSDYFVTDANLSPVKSVAAATTSTLPQTGSVVDGKVLYSVGILMMAIGALLVFRRKKLYN